MSQATREQVIAEAARWLALLRSGDIDALQQQAFLDWQARSPLHATLVAAFEAQVGALTASGLGREPGRVVRVLGTPSSRRGFLRAGLAVAGLALGAGVLSRLGASGFVWPGELYTGIGERRHFTLADGSGLDLNAASRVAPHFAPGVRGLRLQRGELLVEVAPGRVPFELHTEGGRLALQEHRCLLREEGSGWFVQAQGSPVRWHNEQGSQQVIAAGHWARFDRAGIFASGHANGDESEWLSGLLSVDDRPLAEVVERLRAYHRGLLTLAPAIAGLRVSGIFPLDDSQRALHMLAHSLPIRVQRTTELWVSLEPA